MTMNSIKTLGLMASMAMAGMAFVGAPTATAEPTGLCSAEPVVEEEIEQCPTVAHLEGVSMGKAKLLTPLMTVECDVSYLGMETSYEPTLTFTGTFTYSNCGTCKVTEESGAAVFEVLKEGHETAALTGEGLIHVECGGSLSCTYAASGLEGTVTGALLAENGKGELSITEQKVAKESGGIFCPSEAALDLEMEPVSPIYVVGSQVIKMGCKKPLVAIGFFLKNPNGKVCEGFDLLLKGEFELCWLLFSL
jgi:hypothetical protein